MLLLLDCPAGARLEPGAFMPNQRAKNKQYLGGFVDRGLYAELTRLAKRAGMEENRFGFVNQLLREALRLRRRSRGRPGRHPRR